jgi:hypothetical protein
MLLRNQPDKPRQRFSNTHLAALLPGDAVGRHADVFGKPCLRPAELFPNHF